MRDQLFQNLRRSTELRRRRLFDFTEGGQDPICETMFEIALFAILFRFLATERDDRVVDDLLFRSHVRDKRGLDLCQKRSARACSVTVRQLLSKAAGSSCSCLSMSNMSRSSASPGVGAFPIFSQTINRVHDRQGSVLGE